MNSVNEKKFGLITTFSADCGRRRMQDYMYCLKKNLVNESIDLIAILLEESDTGVERTLACINRIRQAEKNSGLFDSAQEFRKAESKIVIKIVNKKPLYKDLFKTSQKIDDKVWILTNADVYFPRDHVLGLRQIDQSIFDKNIIALTRYNYITHERIKKRDYLRKDFVNERPVELQDHKGRSIDSWIYKTPVTLLKCDLNIHVGLPECDRYLNNELSNIKNLMNPCLSIMSVHKHKDWSESSYDQVEVDGLKLSREEWNRKMQKFGFDLKAVPPSSL